MNREAWRATIQRVAKSWTRLSDWTETEAETGSNTAKQPFERVVGLNEGAEVCHSSSPKFIVGQVSDKLQLLMSHLEKDLVYSFSAPTFLAVIWPTDLSPFLEALRTWHTLFSWGAVRTKMKVWTSTIVWEALRISGQNNWWGLSHTMHGKSMKPGRGGCFIYVQKPTEGQEKQRRKYVPNEQVSRNWSK